MLAGVAGPAAAQAPEQIRVRQEATGKQIAEEGGAVRRQVQIVGKMRERMAVEAKTTTGAPYSAEAVTESTQVLADGNRINRKVTTRVYRDGEGRTRREELDESGAVETVSIVDPVADTSYVVNPGPGALPGSDPASARGGGKSVTMYKRSVKIAGPADEAKLKAEIDALEQPSRLERKSEGQGVREDLGTSTIEGLTATGTRTTTTIPAGAIGNLQPITVVSEEWFSPDLQVMLLTRHSDPRAGETVYRLLNVVRAEPDRSLFTIPADEKGLPRSPGLKLPGGESR
jgi:hypothetical protein